MRSSWTTFWGRFDLKQNLLQLLKQKERAYLNAHPKTGEMDLQIAHRFWQGRSAVQVAQEIPCSESTVYRSVRRVKEFLLGKSAYGQILREYIQRNPPNYGDGDAHSILEMLFNHYEEFNQFETEQIRQDFQKIYQELEEVPLKQLDAVIDTTCSLCRNHEMAGFVEGVKVGVRLGVELEN